MLSRPRQRGVALQQLTTSRWPSYRLYMTPKVLSTLQDPRRPVGRRRHRATCQGGLTRGRREARGGAGRRPPKAVLCGIRWRMHDQHAHSRRQQSRFASRGTRASPTEGNARSRRNAPGGVPAPTMCCSPTTPPTRAAIAPRATASAGRRKRACHCCFSPARNLASWLAASCDPPLRLDFRLAPRLLAIHRMRREGWFVVPMHLVDVFCSVPCAKELCNLV